MARKKSNQDTDEETVWRVSADHPRASKRYDDETVATILLEARLFGVQETIQRYGISRDSLSDWRERVKKDVSLQKLVILRQRAYTQDFAEESALAIKECLAYITRAARMADPTDRQMVRAIAGAMKMAGEFRLALDITQDRLGKNNAPALTTGESGYSFDPLESIIEGDFADIVEVVQGE